MEPTIAIPRHDPPNRKEWIAICLISILYLVGLISSFTDQAESVLKFSALHLVLVCAIQLFADRKPTIAEYIIWTWGFLVGFGIEVLGVATLAIFGDYAYLDNLGPKLWNVPLVIGIQWVILAYSAKSVGNWLKLEFWPMVILGIGILVGFDSLMEPVAEELGYWKFKDGLAPFQNYIAWAVVAFGVIYPYKSRYNPIETPNYVALVNLGWYVLFFLRFNFL